MKLNTVLISLLIVTAATALTVGSIGMANGGGMFIDEISGHRVTFGFNVKANDDEINDDETLKGKFQLKDHVTGQEIHVSEILEAYMGTDLAFFSGVTKDGVLVVVFISDFGEPGPDAGEYIKVYYGDSQELSWCGNLVKGNIQIRDI
jgi:hypothetical protein